MKYLKHILIFVIACFSFIFIDNVYAKVTLDGKTMSSSDYKVLNQGNATLNFSSTVVYPTMADFPSYYLLTMCADSSTVHTWTLNTRLNTANIYSTNYKCMFPNSTYTGGHVVYIYGQASGNCGVTGENCLLDSKLTMYVPEHSSWAFLSEQYSREEITIDFASQSIISSNEEIVEQNKTLIEQQATLIDQNMNLWTKQDEIDQSIKDQTDATNKVNDSVKDNTDATKEQTDTIKDSDVTGAQNSANDFVNSFDGGDDYGLSDVITIPLNTIKNIASAKCEPLTFTMPFTGGDVSLPCMTPIYKEHFPQIYNIYTSIVGGVVLYYIVIKYIKFARDFKDPDKDNVEVFEL